MLCYYLLDRLTSAIQRILSAQLEEAAPFNCELTIARHISGSRCRSRHARSRPDSRREAFSSIQNQGRFTKLHPQQLPFRYFSGLHTFWQHLRHTPIGSKQHASLRRQQVPKKARDRGHKKIACGGLPSSNESVGQKPVTNLE